LYVVWVYINRAVVMQFLYTTLILSTQFLLITTQPNILLNHILTLHGWWLSLF